MLAAGACHNIGMLTYTDLQGLQGVQSVQGLQSLRFMQTNMPHCTRQACKGSVGGL